MPAACQQTMADRTRTKGVPAVGATAVSATGTVTMVGTGSVTGGGLAMVVATGASLVASARERRAGIAPETPAEAADAVADEKGTPPTVDGA